MSFIETIEYYLRPSQLIIMFGALFLGVCFGWLFKKRHTGCLIIFAIAGILLFSRILEILMYVDHWILTMPFLIGAAIHPIASRWKR